jgi:hypothetical protein
MGDREATCQSTWLQQLQRRGQAVLSASSWKLMGAGLGHTSISPRVKLKHQAK